MSIDPVGVLARLPARRERATLAVLVLALVMSAGCSEGAAPTTGSSTTTPAAPTAGSSTTTPAAPTAGSTPGTERGEAAHDSSSASRATLRLADLPTGWVELAEPNRDGSLLACFDKSESTVTGHARSGPFGLGEATIESNVTYYQDALSAKNLVAQFQLESTRMCLQSEIERAVRHAVGQDPELTSADVTVAARLGSPIGHGEQSATVVATVVARIHPMTTTSTARIILVRQGRAVLALLTAELPADNTDLPVGVIRSLLTRLVHV